MPEIANIRILKSPSGCVHREITFTVDGKPIEQPWDMELMKRWVEENQDLAVMLRIYFYIVDLALKTEDEVIAAVDAITIGFPS